MIHRSSKRSRQWIWLIPWNLIILNLLKTNQNEITKANLHKPRKAVWARNIRFRFTTFFLLFFLSLAFRASRGNLAQVLTTEESETDAWKIPNGLLSALAKLWKLLDRNNPREIISQAAFPSTWTRAQVVGGSTRRRAKGSVTGRSPSSQPAEHRAVGADDAPLRILIN